MDILIQQSDSGRTLLSYLRSTLMLSSSCITKLKQDERGILVNGRHVTVRYVLSCNDILSLNLNDTKDKCSAGIPPSPIPLDIIYEDENILALNKPPFTPTHPSRDHYTDTLANGVAYMYAQKGEPFVFRAVGRLDRNTSGIVLLGKTMASAAYLSKQRNDGMIKKSYIAILHGELSDTHGIIDRPIRRTSESIITREVCDINDDGAMSAKTSWQALYIGHGISLVKVCPETGRTHQIRVHFKSLGYPLLGDDIYGEDSEYINRHALHAYTLSLTLPFSTDFTTLTASIPADMRDCFSAVTGEDISKYITYITEDEYEI